MVMSLIAKQAAKKLKGNRKSATRLNEAGQRVRAAKENTGAAKQVGNKADRKVQGSPQAQKIRKREDQDVTNLSQPSGGSLGKTVDLADDGIPKYKVSAFEAKNFDKDMKKTKENIKDYQEKLTKLKSSLKAFGGKNPPLERRIESTQILLTQAKQKLADKKSRRGPGGKSKLTTGQRKQIKKAGGPVIKRKTGDRIGTPKVKKIIPDDSFMKGLSQDAIDDILGRPKRDAAGVKRSSKKKKGNTKVAKIKKIPEGPRRPDLGATFRKGGKGGSKSKSKKTFIRKSGGPVVKKMGGGQVLKYGKGTGSKTIKGNMDGNGYVAGCYDKS